MRCARSALHLGLGPEDPDHKPSRRRQPLCPRPQAKTMRAVCSAGLQKHLSCQSYASTVNPQQWRCRWRKKNQRQHSHRRAILLKLLPIWVTLRLLQRKPQGRLHGEENRSRVSATPGKKDNNQQRRFIEKNNPTCFCVVRGGKTNKNQKSGHTMGNKGSGVVKARGHRFFMKWKHGRDTKKKRIISRHLRTNPGRAVLPVIESVDEEHLAVSIDKAKNVQEPAATVAEEVATSTPSLEGFRSVHCCIDRRGELLLYLTP